ncbi:MAG: hypothetical protein Q4G44_06215, partial [Alcaligenaceae bacterium]|nr:hypothetical protein [Alcaligenaceae bacterium]
MKTYNHPLNSISKLVHSANNSNPLSLTKALNESLMAEPNWLATVRESMENTNFILKTLEQPNSIGELAHAAINSNPLSKLKALNESLMPKSNLLAAVRDSRENTNLILKSFEQANSIGELANAAINSNPLSKLKALNESLMPKSNLLAAVR